MLKFVQTVILSLFFGEISLYRKEKIYLCSKCLKCKLKIDLINWKLNHLESQSIEDISKLIRK